VNVTMSNFVAFLLKYRNSIAIQFILV
jgi:hypothetical protein